MNLISLLHRIKQRDGKWIVEGSSAEYDSREEALNMLISQRNWLKKKRKELEGRRFHSEKLNMDFRSNWEVELAELMDELGIIFVYEPRRFYFRVEKESYLPDFYLPEYNCWIEVKGWMDKKSLRRVKLFKKYYGAEYAFFLYEKEERELVLKEPALLFALIESAQRELEREQMRRSLK
jgi:hypothetical protein